jgi:hypothetical protein
MHARHFPVPEVGWRCRHREAPGWPQGDCDRVARDEARGPYAEIKALRDDIDQPPLGHQIDVNPRITTQELQNERRQDLAGGGRKGVDPQRSGWRLLLRARGVDRRVDGLQRGADLIGEDPPGVGR